MAEKIKFRHSLGDEVRDTVTGYEGIVTGSYAFINGCRRYTVEAPSKGPGEVPTDFTVDEDRLVTVTAVKDKVKPVSTGGPRATPARSHDPRR